MGIFRDLQTDVAHPNRAQHGYKEIRVYRGHIGAFQGVETIKSGGLQVELQAMKLIFNPVKPEMWGEMPEVGCPKWCPPVLAQNWIFHSGHISMWPHILMIYNHF